MKLIATLVIVAGLLWPSAAHAALPCSVSPPSAAFDYPVARVLIVADLTLGAHYAVYVHPYPDSLDLGMFNLYDNVADSTGALTYLFAAPYPIAGQWYVEVYTSTAAPRNKGQAKRAPDPVLVAACGFEQT